MGDDESRMRIGCGPTLAFGLAGLIALFTLGPIDGSRTAYNALVGDVPLVRERAVNYVRRGIAREHPSLDDGGVEKKLAEVLGYRLNDDKRVNPQKVRMMELWDATEDYAPNVWEQWVWPSLD